MSEYQYYEFLALDRPLTEQEVQELRSISSRAQISPTHFQNEYSFGDLKADPLKLLERYFDVHVYVANWGTHRLAMRVPREVVPLDEVAPYCLGHGGSARVAGQHLLISLSSQTEDYEDWVEGESEGWMASLAGVRGELLRGDARPLYLAWLLSVEGDGVADDDLEPPVPPGLADLSASLRALAEFLRIDEHLFAAAAEGSQAEEPEPAGLAQWIAALAADGKDALLLKVAHGEHAQIAAALVRRFRADTRHDARDNEQPRRTVGRLQARASELREAHAREQAREAAEEHRRREAAAAVARAKHLDALAACRPEAWEDVERLVAWRQSKSYDEAVALLVDLRDLAARDGGESSFATRLAAVRERHARKPSFIAKLDKAGFPEGTS